MDPAQCKLMISKSHKYTDFHSLRFKSTISCNIRARTLIYCRFVTLTPISEDDSRHDIPDNLKLFFRPVAMTMPDMEVVAGVLLYSMGFTKVLISG